MKKQLIQVFGELLKLMAIASGRSWRSTDKADYSAKLEELADTFLDRLERIIHAVTSESDPQAQQRVVIDHLVAMISEIGLVPDGVDLFHYCAALAERMASPPAGWVNQPPWCYRQRHEGYRSFLRRLIQARGLDGPNSFLSSAFAAHDGILPQFQRLMNGGWIPRHLRAAPRQFTVKVVLRKLEAWRSVAGDWEQLTRLPYGLLCISKGESRTTWENTATKLHKRVDDLLQDPDLRRLVRKDWVIIRNALAHGTAYYNPVDATVEFIDRRRKITRAVNAVRAEAIDMALSNRAMLMTQLIFIDAAYDDVRLQWT